jgi:hypothetical protein
MTSKHRLKELAIIIIPTILLWIWGFGWVGVLWFLLTCIITN